MAGCSVLARECFDLSVGDEFTVRALVAADLAVDEIVVLRLAEEKLLPADGAVLLDGHVVAALDAFPVVPVLAPVDDALPPALGAEAQAATGRRGRRLRDLCRLRPGLGVFVPFRGFPLAGSCLCRWQRVVVLEEET